MATQPEKLADPQPELARLEALARVAGAAAHGGGLDAVLTAIVQGVQDAFGLEVVLNLYDAELDRYLVRAVVGEGEAELMGTSTPRGAFDDLLLHGDEIVPDVTFIPHDRDVDLGKLGAIHTPAHGWPGPGYWHPMDMCIVRMRTSRGEVLGLLSVDSDIDRPIPDVRSFEVLRLFAMVGANAVENVLLVREIAGLEEERERHQLRRELEEEVALRRSLLEVGGRIGAASAAASSDIFPLVAERLAFVVPIKSLTIWMVDHDAGLIRPLYHSEPGPVADAVMAYEFPFGVGATGVAVREGHSVIANQDETDADLVKVIPGTPDVPEHVLAVPVLVEERVNVALTLRRFATEPPFLPEDARRAELFGQHLASAFLLMELAEKRRLLADQVEELEGLNRLKDEFVAGVSHELRTPLTAIIGSVATVSRLGDMLAADQRRQLLGVAERQAKRLAELLENLLAESRLAGDDPAMALVPVDLAPFLEEVADTMRFRAPARIVDTSCPAGLDLVTDRTLLYRILFNLGDNALKYSEGPVQLEARPEGAEIRIDVRDQGVGIPPEHLATVFERFRQLDTPDGRHMEGVGLGLHLVARVAEALGGRIEVDSEPGRGSTFSVWLPKAGPPVRP
ncbi:MAG: ATP-binding protein [Actinomycetota bacterium]|nr:ATP-binding protein [Actinomycetota bacterium]